MRRDSRAIRVGALAAAYLIAVQAMFAVLLPAMPAGAEILCASLDHDTGGGPAPSPHDHCPACPPSCGDSMPALAATSTVSIEWDTSHSASPPLVGQALSRSACIDGCWARGPPAYII